MEGDLVHIPDYAERFIQALPSQFRHKTILRAFALGLAAALQRQEDEVWALYSGTNFFNATGRSLDLWGLLVGEPRGGLPDDIYRQFISARILADRSIGATDEIIQIAQLVTAPSTVTHLHLPPACFNLTIRREALMGDTHAARVVQILGDVKPEGVCMELVEAEAGYYGYQPDPEALGLDVGRFARGL